MQGRVIRFSQKWSKAEKSAFVDTLPKRKNFTTPYPINSSSLYFLPNYVKDMNRKESKLESNLLCIGVDLHGNKVAILINGFRMFFDIRVPDDVTLVRFENRINDLLTTTKYKPDIEFEHISAKPALYYHKDESMFLRVTFTNSLNRKTAHNILSSGFKYVNNSGEECKYSEPLYTDDTNNLHRVYSRTTKQRFCEWWCIDKYIPETRYFKDNVKGYKVYYADITRVKESMIESEAKKLGIPVDAFLKDRTMEMSWDLETISFEPTGQPPDRNRIAVEGNIINKIFMDSITVFWYWQKEPLITICITDMPVPPRPDCLIIQVDSDIEIILVKALVIESLLPDIITAFNGDQYDWPFVRATIETYDVIHRVSNYGEFFKKRMSVVSNIADAQYYTRHWTYAFVKLEGGGDNKIRSDFYDIVGTIVFDVRTIFRKIYSTSEESSLNFYLKKERLPTKVDMPYSRMFIIYIILKTLERHYGTSDYNSIVNAFKQNPPATLPVYDFNKAYLTPGSDFYIDVKGNILDYINDASNVVHYCNIDSISCHELMLKRNILGDKRKWANLAYVNLYDTIYYADGMKVRNIIMAKGIKNNLMFPVATHNEKSEKKYPGAIVINPIKGFYKNHKFEKRLHRESFQHFVSNHSNKEVMSEVQRSDFNEVYNLTEDECRNNETTDISDRPMGACDFSSLYPNVDISINGSPEKVLRRPEDAPKDADVLKTEFTYDLESADPKTVMTAYILQYDKKSKDFGGGMGLYPSILRKMYLARSKVKKLLGPYESAKKVLDKCDINLPLQPQLEEKIKVAEQVAAVKNKTYYDNELKYLKGTVLFILSKPGTSVEVYDHVVFYYNYYNSMQLAIKIFMNTFYGDTGNSTSPLFMVEIAASITAHGRNNLMAVERYAKDNGFRVLYGDTDSLYLTAMDSYFSDVDKQYFDGKIDRLKYWELMIDITQEEIEAFKKKINKFLNDLHVTQFLAVDTEGVAYPYMLCGKKKYIMLKHIGVSNLALCTATSINDVASCPNLDIRGFEIKKRGASQFLKQEFSEILLKQFSVSDNTSLIAMVEVSLQNIKNRTFKVEDFVKSAKYKPASNGKPGNRAVIEFIEKMRTIVENIPNIGITLPMPCDRFKFVITKKPPHTITLRGTKKDISAGEKYEFYDSFYNDRYIGAFGALEADVDYYIEREIIGQFARLLTYHPRFDVHNIEDFKEADKKAHESAKKYLMGLFKPLRDIPSDIDMTPHKQAFVRANSIVRSKLSNVDGVALLDMMNTFVTSTEVVGDDFVKGKTAFVYKAIKVLDGKAERLVAPLSIDVVPEATNKGMTMAHLNSMYLARQSYARNRIRVLSDMIRDAKVELHNSMSVLQVSLYNYRKVIEAVRDMQLRGEVVDLEITGVDPEILRRAYNAFERVIDLTRSKNTLEKIISSIQYHQEKDSKIVSVPRSINKRDILERYLDTVVAYPAKKEEILSKRSAQPKF